MIDVTHRDLVLAGGAALRVSGDGVDHDRVAALLAPYVVPRPSDHSPAPRWSVSFDSPRAGARRIEIAGTTVRVWAERRHDPDQIFAFQLIRALLVEQVLNSHATLHGAVLSHGGRGIVFTGGKGAGKTSFLTAFLRLAAHLAVPVSFVTNDKSVVSPRSSSIVGLPYAVAVGHQGRRMTPELASVSSRSTGEKDLIWPADFARAFGAGLAMSCEPTAVVVCEAEFGADQVAVGPSVPAAERVRILGTEMADFGEAMLLDFLAGHPDRSPQTPGPALPVLWADLPWIRLSGNPWTMSASIANTILAAASSPVGKVE